MIPPSAQPTMKTVVAIARVRGDLPEGARVAGSTPRSSVIAGFRARLKNCWSIVSKSQPSEATMNTNHWYRVTSRHQGAPSSSAAGPAAGLDRRASRTISERREIGMTHDQTMP